MMKQTITKVKETKPLTQKTPYGLWYIYEMEVWDQDYFNMEAQAFIRINKNKKGEFQFGLVTGYIDGRKSGDKFEFTWEGYDECSEESGSGWFRLVNEDTIEGEFKVHMGDRSKFKARRVKQTKNAKIQRVKRYQWHPSQ